MFLIVLPTKKVLDHPVVFYHFLNCPINVWWFHISHVRISLRLATRSCQIQL
jgi:hypothetical protein